MKKIVLIFAFLSLFSCSLFEEEVNTDIDIITGFNDTSFSGYFNLGSNTIPLDGAFVHITKNSTFDEIIINLAPANVSGSVAFPGRGWVQFRFNINVQPGIVTGFPLEDNFTVAGIQPLEIDKFQSIYIGEDGINRRTNLSSEVLVNELSYDSPDKFNFRFEFRSQDMWFPLSGTQNAEQGDIFFSVAASRNGLEDNSSNPIEGTWTLAQANCNNLLAEISFGASSGEVMIPDCNNTGTCPTGSVTEFNYTTTATEITFNYTKFTVCGQTANTPDGGTISYSINGNQLTLGSQTWTRK